MFRGFDQIHSFLEVFFREFDDQDRVLGESPIVVRRPT